MANEIEASKIGAGYRILCFFGAFIAIIGLMGAAAFGRNEGISMSIILVCLGPALLLYIFIPIIFTGYPPRLLRWAQDRR